MGYGNLYSLIPHKPIVPFLLCRKMSEVQVNDISSTVPDKGMERQVNEELFGQGFHAPDLCSRVMIGHPSLSVYGDH